LPNRNRVDELLVGQPAEAQDEIVAEEGEQDIATAIKNGTDFEEGEE